MRFSDRSLKTVETRISLVVAFLPLGLNSPLSHSSAHKIKALIPFSAANLPAHILSEIPRYPVPIKILA